jgi:hypothetical protein
MSVYKIKRKVPRQKLLLMKQIAQWEPFYKIIQFLGDRRITYKGQHGKKSAKFHVKNKSYGSAYLYSQTLERQK